MGTLEGVPAREVLDVVWNGEFHTGIIAYGLRKAGTTRRAVFPYHAWPSEIEVEEFRLHGETWEVIRWDIQVDRWPEAAVWKDVVRETLNRLIEADSVVAWLGTEGWFADPPDLFLPEQMSTGVLASLTESGEFLCPLDLDEPLRTLTDSQLLKLRAASKGLAEGR